MTEQKVETKKIVINLEHEKDKIGNLSWYHIVQYLILQAGVLSTDRTADWNGDVAKITLTVETTTEGGLTDDEVWALIQGQVSGVELTRTS